MALTYRKLAHVTAEVDAGTLSRATLLASIEANETIVVTLKGRWLTAAQVAAHLLGQIDGETIER